MTQPMPRTASTLQRFEDTLASEWLQGGALTAAELREIQLRQGAEGLTLAQAAVDLEFVEPQRALTDGARILDVPSIDLTVTPGDASAIECLPRSLAFELQVIPLFAVHGELTVATSEPFDLEKMDTLRFATAMEILPVFALPNDITLHLTSYYGEYDANFDPFMIEFEGRDTDLGLSLDDPEAEVDRPVVRLVNLILSSCIVEGASDIHLEPQSKSMTVRSRVDGVMRPKPYHIPREVESGVVVRIKVLGGMDISERRRPQDGKIRIRLQGRRIDVRVSTFPTIHGEKLVLRLLDKERSDFSLTSIGMDSSVSEGWMELLKGLEGILLVTGPTGSGKSSTLYASLRHLHQPDVNIVTLEDPVEYELDGITQSQVHRAAGFTFATGLRAILRQDPDIVLVGEIRDAETAEIAAKAALTGQLVLATLHTNSAPGAITRLVDLGVDRYLVSSALRGVLAQRLIRRNCEACALDRPLDKSEERELGAERKIKSVRVGDGCPKCHGSGYAGRTGIHELLTTTGSIKRLISSGAPESELAAAGRESGYETLWEDGLRKVADGTTTPQELLRVAPRQQEELDR